MITTMRFLRIISKVLAMLTFLFDIALRLSAPPAPTISSNTMTEGCSVPGCSRKRFKNAAADNTMSSSVNSHPTSSDISYAKFNAAEVLPTPNLLSTASKQILHPDLAGPYI